jgi:hypothetical protein
VLSKNVEKVLNFPCNSISFVCRKVQKVEQGFFSFTAFVCAAIGKYPENQGQNLSFLSKELGHMQQLPCLHF